MIGGMHFSRAQRHTIVLGILSIVVIIVAMQLWLFVATMNAYLSGDEAVLGPAALFSLTCLGLNAGLFWQLYSLE